jgi:hypothetical protein
LVSQLPPPYFWSDANCPSSAAGSGYQQLASGIIIQWGTYNCAGGSHGPFSVTLPVSFPSGILWAIAADTANGGTSNYLTDTVDLSDSTFSHLKIYISSATYGSLATWMAVGY